MQYRLLRYSVCTLLVTFVLLCGCRTDDYSDNPPYYSSPSSTGSGPAWSSVNTTQTGSPLWVPVPTGTTNPSPVTTGVVQAGGTGTVAAPAGVPAGYTAYTCVPTQTLMSDGRGGYTVGTVQMLQPVGVVGAAQGTGTTAVGGVAQAGYNGTVYSATVQPLANYPNYGTMQTPGGTAVVAIPSTGTSTGTVTTSTVGAYGANTGTGTALMAPVPAGTNNASSGTLTPPPTFADPQTPTASATNSGYSLP